MGSLTRQPLPQVQNLTTRSEEFDHADWNSNNLITVTANQATAPDGTVSADKIAAATGIGQHFAAQNFTMPAAYQFSPRVITNSCFVKRFSGSDQWVAIGDGSHTDFVYAWFDVLNGVVGSVTAPNPTATVLGSGIVSMSSLGGGSWFRCWISYLMVSTSGGTGPASQSILILPTTGDGVQSYDGAANPRAVFAWGAQIVCGPSSPGDYVKTIASRVDSGSIRQSVQPSQNFCLRSEQFANAAWAKGVGVIVTDNTSDVPDPLGGSTASKLAYDGTSTAGSIKIYQSAFTSLVGRFNWISVWIRVLTGTKNLLITDNASAAFKAIAATVTWQRFDTGGVSTGAFAAQCAIYDAAAENAPFTIYLWGGQLVQSNWPGAYTKTITTPINNGPIRFLRS